MMLIGNMADLEVRREVPEEEARAYAERNGMEYFETSAMTGANVEEAFMACALAIKRKPGAREIDVPTPTESRCAVN
jgi:hypothetical protein